MSIQTRAQSIPRAAVHGSLRLLRLPLGAAESIAGRHNGDKDTWPPTITYEAFEAQVKSFMSAVLRDEDLGEEATLQRARVAQLRRTVDLDARATAEKVRADHQLDERREEARSEAEQAREQRDAEKRQAEEKRAAAKEATKATTARKKQAAGRRKQEELSEIEADATVVEAEAVAEKREALTEKKAALAKKEQARTLRKAAETTQKRRQAAKRASS